MFVRLLRNPWNSGAVRQSGVQVLDASLLGSRHHLVVIQRISQRVLRTPVHSRLNDRAFLLLVRVLRLLLDLQLSAHPLIPLLKQVIRRRNMIMLISLDVLLCILLVKPKLLQQVQDVLVNGDVGDPCALLKDVLGDLGEGEPGVAADVLGFVAFFGVCVEDGLHEVSAGVGDEFGDEEVAAEDLFVEFGGVGVFEGEVAADQSEKDDAG